MLRQNRQVFFVFRCSGKTPKLFQALRSFLVETELGGSVGEGSLESPLDSKEIKPVSPKGNQHSIFIGRADAKAPVLCLPHVKSRLIAKDLDAGKDWRQEKGTTEDEMVGWHHWFNGHEFEQTGRWWRTGKPGMLQSTGLQRVGHHWTTTTGCTGVQRLWTRHREIQGDCRKHRVGHIWARGQWGVPVLPRS